MQTSYVHIIRLVKYLLALLMLKVMVICRPDTPVPNSVSKPNRSNLEPKRVHTLHSIYWTGLILSSLV
jgi:hypothetical protein